jgi:hypothetical protein
MGYRVIVGLTAGLLWLLSASCAEAAPASKVQSKPKPASSKPWGGTPPPNPAKHKSGQPYAKPRGNVSTSNQVLDWGKGGKTSKASAPPAKAPKTTSWGAAKTKTIAPPAKASFGSSAAKKIGAKTSGSQTHKIGVSSGSHGAKPAQRGLGAAVSPGRSISTGSPGKGRAGFSEAARKIGGKPQSGSSSRGYHESPMMKQARDKQEADLQKKIKDQKHKVWADDQNILDAQKRRRGEDDAKRQRDQGIISGHGERMAGQEADKQTYKFRGQDRGAAPVKAIGTELWQSQQERDANVKGIDQFEQRMKDKREADKADLERYKKDLEKLRQQRAPKPVSTTPGTMYIPPSTQAPPVDPKKFLP